MRPLSLEEDIADKYVQCRRNIHPSYIAGFRHEDCWRKAADLVRRLKADPRLFVEAQFKIAESNDMQEVPYPSQLSGPAAAANYQKFIESYRPEIELVMAQQFRILYDYMERCSQTLDEAVSHPINTFRPFFRLLVCSDEAYEKIKPQWRVAALKELHRNRDLHDHLFNKYGNRAQRLIWEGIPGIPDSTHHPVPPPSPPSRTYPDLTRRF